MTVRAAWERLGIEPTPEAREVKRAYARLLKEIDADADPAGFIALRDAYETALASGGTIPEWEQDDWDPGLDDWESDGEHESSHAMTLDEAGDAPHAGGVVWDALRWRPAAPYMAPGGLGAALRALDRLLFDAPEEEPEAIAAAWAELLLELDRSSVDEASEAELWLASAIGASIPRSDPLVIPAIRRFGWYTRGGGPSHNWDIELVLDRAEDLRFVRICRDPASAYHRAYRELTGRPREKVSVLQLGLAQDVRDLIKLARSSYPTLERDFDPETRDWWDAYFRGPHLPSSFWIIIACAPLLPIYTGLVAFGSRWAIAVIAASVLLVLASILAWSRVRPRLRRKLDERRWRGARWERQTFYSLAGALMLPPIAAAAPHGLLSGTLVALAAAILMCLIWRNLPPTQDEDEGARSERQYGAIVAGVVGTALLFGLPQQAAFKLIMPILALVVAAAAGYEIAATAFERLRRGPRVAILAGAAAAALLLAMPFATAMPQLPPPYLAVLVPVVVAIQHLATAAARQSTPHLDWPLRIGAGVFYGLAGHAWYEGDAARAVAAAACLYAVCFSVVRIGVVASAALDARPHPGAA